MYKNAIPLVSAEEIGYHLGLTVSPERSQLFYNVRTSDKKPLAGYGTRIYLPEFEPNIAFKNLGIPLKFTLLPVADRKDTKALLQQLAAIESKDGDVLLCFNQGVLHGDTDKDWGHVVVFDRLINGQVRIIDPSPDAAKWQLLDLEKLFEAMVQHGQTRSGGLWVLERTM